MQFGIVLRTWRYLPSGVLRMSLPIALPYHTVCHHVRGVGDIRVRRLARALVLVLLLSPSVVLAVDAGDEVAPPSAQAQRYMTQPGDTLWEIAIRFSQADEISPQQMMLALRDANPAAFAAGNINNLKTGYILRIPSRETILAIGASEATAEVARQNALWRAPRARLAAPASQPAPATESPPAPVSVETISEDTRGSPGAEGQDTAPPQHDSVLAREPANRHDPDSEALRARVAVLEEKLATLDGIIAVQHEQLAELRQRRAAETMVREPEPSPGDSEATAAKPPPSNRSKAWFAAPNTVIPLSAIAVLGLAATWLLVRRATENRVALDTAPGVAERTGAEPLATEEVDALAIGIDDLNQTTQDWDTRSAWARLPCGVTQSTRANLMRSGLDLGPQEGAAPGHPGERAEPVGLEAAVGEGEDRMEELAIDVDDLELEPEPEGEKAYRQEA
jgi:FimV-like protein